MLTGNIRKMVTQLDQSVHYSLPIGDQHIVLSDCLGKSLSMQFTGNIHCVQCGRKTSKSFQQGHCYPCFKRITECGNCMLFPDKCLASEEHCDPNDWVHASCLQPHVVYLANSSALKVGITRATQVPTRWIDQGAVQALPIFSTSNRKQAGLIENVLATFVNDKTNWRKMLSGVPDELDLIREKARLLEQADEPLQQMLAQLASDAQSLIESESVKINFPVNHYPQKIKSFNFDKEPNVKGVLQGIKGQYLLLDNGVINLRKFGGYELMVDV